jgi:hypothetical protein
MSNSLYGSSLDPSLIFRKKYLILIRMRFISSMMKMHSKGQEEFFLSNYKLTSFQILIESIKNTFDMKMKGTVIGRKEPNYLRYKLICLYQLKILLKELIFLMKLTKD